MPPAYRNMSKREHDKYYKFVLGRDGCFCSRCRKDLDTIKKEYKLANPNKKRKLKWLYLHHVDGDERFPDSRDGTYAGNLKLVCSACNQLLRIRVIAPSTLRPMTPEMQLSQSAKPKFFAWVDNYLANYGHLCEERMINRGSKIAGVLQPSIVRYFKQEVHYKYEEFDLSLTDEKCDYPDCNTKHICNRGEKPRTKDQIAEIVREEEQQTIL